MPNTEQQPNERDTCFPLTEEVIKEEVQEIRTDPNTVNEKSLAEMEAQNPWLWAFCAVIHKEFYAGGNDGYIFGVGFTYAILKRQAQERGGLLPIVSNEQALSALQSLSEQSVQGTRELSVDEDTNAIVNRFRTEEILLSSALDDLATAWELDVAAMLRGAADLVYLIKRQIEANHLGHKFQ